MHKDNYAHILGSIILFNFLHCDTIFMKIKFLINLISKNLILSIN